MEGFNKKRTAIICGIVIIISICSVFGIAKMKRAKSQNVKNIEIPKSVAIRYAFADVDFDQIIKDVDDKDDDSKADYLFIRFTGRIIPSKVKNSIFDVKSYKLDGKEIPKSSVVMLEPNSGDTTMVIKLPNGLLKGKNAGHQLEINKSVNINNVTKVEGNLKFKLPYSTKTTSSLEKSNDKDSNEKHFKEKSKVSGDKDLNSNKQQNNGQVPKCSIEVGKGIPFVTVVLVKLEVKDPAKYSVQVGEDKLDMKKNKKGELVFIKVIKKDYSYADVQDRLKITKVK